MRWRELRRPAFLTSLAVLAGAAAALGATIRINKIYLQKLPIEALDEEGRRLPFGGLPDESTRWRKVGVDQVLSAEVVEELGTQNYLSRWYVEVSPAPGAGAREFELHLAYYTGTVDTVPHVPERCYVGGGIELAGPTRIVPAPIDLSLFPPDRTVDAASEGAVRTGRSVATHNPVRLPVGVEDLRMNVSPYRAGDTRMFAGYFFIANGRVLPTAEAVRQHAFGLKDSYAYYAKVQFMSQDVGSAEELASLAAEFLNEMLPEIARRTPDWVEVRRRSASEGEGREGAEQAKG